MAYPTITIEYYNQLNVDTNYKPQTMVERRKAMKIKGSYARGLNNLRVTFVYLCFVK